MQTNINPLNAELNPTCHLLAFLGGHHILHVNRIRVKINLCTCNWYSLMASMTNAKKFKVEIICAVIILCQVETDWYVCPPTLIGLEFFFISFQERNWEKTKCGKGIRKSN